jgi:hypothetical protein
MSTTETTEPTPDYLHCRACFYGICETQGGDRDHEHLDTVSPCLGCKKMPSELSEYVTAARDSDYASADEFVKHEEGTYGIKGPGTFLCTPCYIEAGMPLNYSRM